MTTIRVVAAAVRPNGATLYTEAGETITLPASDPQTAPLVRQINEEIERQRKANPKVAPVAVVNLETKTMVFQEIEDKSKGLMRFFRIPKAIVGAILGSRAKRGPVNPHGMVTHPTEAVDPETMTPLKEQPGTPPLTEKIIQQLEQASLKATGNDDNETVVAVVDKTPIVGAEALAGHARAAVAQGNAEGFQRFMERLGRLTAERKHTSQELVSFLSKNDLPIANDGTIIVYKSLSKTGKKNEDGLDIFVDNHTSSWQQCLGTVVEMAVEMVNDNRRVLCSNGFHVGRRGYFRGYGITSENALFLAKVAPEDVISVPMSEADKMRVASYFLVAQLPDGAKDTLKQQRSITKESDTMRSILAKVIMGDHVKPTYKTHKMKPSDPITFMQRIIEGESVPTASEIAGQIKPALDNQKQLSSETFTQADENMLAELEDRQPENLGAVEIMPVLDAVIRAKAETDPPPVSPFITEQEKPAPLILTEAHTVDHYSLEEKAPEETTPLDVASINAAQEAKREQEREKRRARDKARREKAKPLGKSIPAKKVETTQVEVKGTGGSSAPAVKSTVTMPAVPDFGKKAEQILAGEDLTSIPVEQKKIRARSMWAEGKTKAEIRKVLNVAESTLRGWLK